jgi:hypothetical protein
LLLVAPRWLTINELEDVLDVKPESLAESIAWLSPRLLASDSDRYSIEFGSIIEYLTDRKRSGRKFMVDVATEHDKLTVRCLEVLMKGDMYVGSINPFLLKSNNLLGRLSSSSL